MSQTTNSVRSLCEKAFVGVLLLLGAIALSLFLIFRFISTTQIGPLAGMLLFILVAVLLIAGYMLGILVLGYLAIYILPRTVWPK
jgi:hypothetical protein